MSAPFESCRRQLCATPQFARFAPDAKIPQPVHGGFSIAAVDMRNNKKIAESLTVKLPKTSLLKLQLAIFIRLCGVPLAVNIDFGTQHHFSCVDVFNQENS